MSNYCMTENLDELEDILRSGSVFDSDLKISTLLMILEIIWNAVKNNDKKCRKCFSRRTRKGVKRNRSLLKFLFSKKNSLDERKSRFLSGDKKFKAFVKRLLQEFLKNALDRAKP